MKRRQHFWLLVIPVLLLATGLAAHRLDGYPTDSDELVTVRLAGRGTSSNLAEVWAAVIKISPDQSFGLPLLYSLWARVFGWSEFALRVLPLFAGLLALAWTYRAGHDLFAPLVGLVAAMLLTSSVYFVTYLHVARPYSMVVLFVVMSIWGYWRLALRRPVGGTDRAGQLVLLVGSLGIFYTHYYAVLLLVALSLWHLLFMSKNRGWWRPVLLWGLATIAALPQLAGLLEGLNFVQTKSWHTHPTAMMRTAEALPWFLHVLTNGILRLPGVRLPVVPNIVALVLLTLAVSFGWWRYRQREWFRQLHFLPFASLAVLLMVLFVNEILLLIRLDRLRYFMALWPMIAILVGWGIWRTRGHWRLVAGLLTGAWVAFGFWANTAGELRYEFYELLHRSRLILADREMKVYAGQWDLLLIDDQLYQTTAQYYLPRFPEKHLILKDSQDSRAELARAVQEHLRLLLLAGEADGVEHRAVIAQLPSDMVFCGRYVDRDDLVLELYAWSVAHCPNDEPAQLRFGEEVELVASEVTIIRADMLRVDLLMHTDKITGMTAYSVALHVFDLESGEKVAQGDRGLWLGRYNPLRSEIDISGLMAGEYELRVGVYNWQTLEQLEGVDLRNGVTADLLTLSRFRIE